LKAGLDEKTTRKYRVAQRDPGGPLAPFLAHPFRRLCGGVGRSPDPACCQTQVRWPRPSSWSCSAATLGSFRTGSCESLGGRLRSAGTGRPGKSGLFPAGTPAGPTGRLGLRPPDQPGATIAGQPFPHLLYRSHSDLNCPGPLANQADRPASTPT
jgi:hypothetical protein